MTSFPSADEDAFSIPNSVLWPTVVWLPCYYGSQQHMINYHRTNITYFNYFGITACKFAIHDERVSQRNFTWLVNTLTHQWQWHDITNNPY